MAQARLTSFRLVSYARAHDYNDSNAGQGTARFQERWTVPGLRLVLEEAFLTSAATTASGTQPTSVRLRVVTSPDHDSASQLALRGETYEDLDLSLFQRLLDDSPAPKDNTGFPLRVGYRGTQVVVRYQVPVSIPMPRGIPVAFRRFQLYFADESDVPRLINAIRTYAHCADQSDAGKAAAKKSTKSSSSRKHQHMPHSAMTTEAAPASSRASAPSSSSSSHLPSSSYQPPSQPAGESLLYRTISSAPLPVPFTAEHRRPSGTFNHIVPRSQQQPNHAQSTASSSALLSHRRPQSAMAPPRAPTADTSLSLSMPPRPTTAGGLDGTTIDPASLHLHSAHHWRPSLSQSTSLPAPSSPMDRASTSFVLGGVSTSLSQADMASFTSSFGANSTSAPDAAAARSHFTPASPIRPLSASTGPGPGAQHMIGSTTLAATSAPPPAPTPTLASDSSSLISSTSHELRRPDPVVPTHISSFDWHTKPSEVDVLSIISSLRASSSSSSRGGAGEGGSTANNSNSLLTSLMNQPNDLHLIVTEMLGDPTFVQLINSISVLLKVQ